MSPSNMGTTSAEERLSCAFGCSVLAKDDDNDSVVTAEELLNSLKHINFYRYFARKPERCTL